MLELTMSFVLATSSFAAPPDRPSGAELLRDARKLSVLGTVLYVAAHPDDENTRLLATLANDTLVRAVYLSLTRGEGGQNLIGQELGPALGVIRTQELLAARRLDGAEQRFTRARDFGFSKSVDETLARWDHDGVLQDTVAVIRELRPDVIVTRFSPEPSDTHGHHTASARIAVEAFTAAADPRWHPELGAAWRATRVVWNAWSPDPSVKLDLSKATHLDSSPYSPLLGLSFGELAADSRSMHKSQGFGAAPTHGSNQENFVPLAGDAGVSLLAGVDLTWARVPGADGAAKLLAQAAAELRVDRPADALNTLLAAHAALKKVPPHPYQALKLAELERLIAHCAGVYVEAAAASAQVVPGGTVDVTLTALVRGSKQLVLAQVRLSDGQQVAPGTAKVTLAVPADAPYSTPEWLERPTTAPEPTPTLWVDFDFGALTVRRPVLFKWTDPTAGERFRPVEVLPPVVLAPDAPLLVFVDGAAKVVKVSVAAQADGQAGEVRPVVPTGFTVTPAAAPFSLAKKGDAVELAFEVRAPKGGAAEAVVQWEARLGAKTVGLSLQRVEYAHIPVQVRLFAAQTKVVRFELKKGGAKVGYVPGAGDDVPAALRQVGYEVTVLDDEALRTRPLRGFDAVVLGVRAYNVNAKLPAHRAKLLDYVQGGGVVVLQYNTKNRLSDLPAQLGPYPFDVSRDRVTDEAAEVTFTQPGHRVLQKPNVLGPKDFDGWVQERGLYFAGTWDKQYQTPLAMNDPGEPPRQGSLLVAAYGKGAFVYTGLAFFRQLPAGVPGAYRLFANLLAHGR